MRPIHRRIPEAKPKSSAITADARRPGAICILTDSDLIYGPQEMSDINRLVDLIAPPQNAASILNHPEILARTEVLLTGWGGPVLDEAFLAGCPRLKAVFYGAGAVSHIATAAVWDRRIILSSAYAANAVPVAEYTLAAILFSLKHGWRLSRNVRDNTRFCPPVDIPGGYRSTVGLVSMGMVARTLLKHLALCDLRVLAFDPLMDQAEATELGIELVPLEELFIRSEVVSAHTPLFAETVGLITGKHMASMKTGATFINTSRGRIVREEEMLDVLEQRPDLQAVLDVCTEEPPHPESRLLSLPNIVLTPHIAGSVGAECRRMGRFVVEELQRYLTGQALRGLITPALAARSSHRPVRARRPHEPVSAMQMH